jgi:peptidoglycan/LPS O-acetylase OafA/YrhL
MSHSLRYLRTRPTALLCLISSFLQPRSASQSHRVHATSYLNGLRGYASIVVFIFHAFRPADHWLLRLPFIRILFEGGHGMVAIFFVISGYALSYRMLEMIRARQSSQLLHALASSMFRRFFRLHGSTGVATFISMLTIHFRKNVSPGMTPKSTFVAQFWDWMCDFVYSSNPFANIEGWVHEDVFTTRYLGAMWTIPVEYRGSMTIYVICVVCSQLSMKARRACLLAIVLAAYVWKAVYVAEFVLGMFLADMSLHRRASRFDVPSMKLESGRSDRKWHHTYTDIIAVVLLILGSVLLAPGYDVSAAGLQPYLLNLAPPWYGEAAYTFWLSIGGFMVVYAIDTSPMLQIPLSCRLSEYLGDISFGVYAVHMPVTIVLYYDILEPYRELYLGNSLFAYIPGTAINIFGVLWMAHYFSKLDRLMIHAVKRLECITFSDR